MASYNGRTADEIAALALVLASDAHPLLNGWHW